MRICQKVFGMLLLALLPAALAAQNYVYTNDDNATTNGNTVAIFSVAANGVLSQNSSCPSIATGGTGGGGGFFASNRIVTVGGHLYAANSGSNNVSGFTVNSTSGCLVSIGSPVATGGTAGSNGMSLAATPNGQYLYAGNAESQNITVFSIGSGGALTAVGSPVAAGGEPAGMKVSPDGKYLVAALPEGSSGSLNKIAVFSIGSGGALTAVTGSPFASLGAEATGVDINCSSTQLFVGNATVGAAQVDVFNFPPSGGSMTEIASSPFTGAASPTSQNSNVVALSPGGSELFVSNQASNSVTVFSVGSGGALTLVSGSPFTSGVGILPGGMATDQQGSFLYAANSGSGSGSTLSSLAIGSGGALSTTTGSPFSDPNSTVLKSLAAYPAPTCSGSAAPALLSAKLDINSDGFDMNGTFTPGSGGSINVPGNPVTVQVGPSYSFTIPGGSLSLISNGNYAGGYVFSGTINGVAIQVQIGPLQGGSYQIKVDASGVGLTGLTNPVSVTVTMGGETGTAQVSADFE